MWRLGIIFFALMFSFSIDAKDTELKLYRPFVEEKKLAIIQKTSGECWQQSKRIQREDAWRCTVGEKVYDPCFVKPHGSLKTALCPQSPWNSDTVEIDLVSPVDGSQNVTLDMSEAYPWALELTTGEKCQAVDEGEEYDGLPVHYHCDGQTILIGRVQRCTTLWRMLQKNTAGVSTTFIARAWF